MTINNAKSGKLLTHYIFPLIHSYDDASGNEIVELVGTGFLVGNRGYALTAAHVVNQLLDFPPDSRNNCADAGFVIDHRWHGFAIAKHEIHPSEDVAIIQLAGSGWKSILQLDSSPHNSAEEYHCWGYPHAVSEEMLKLEQSAKVAPQLIFAQGYIRRRVSHPLPVSIFAGTQFYELSEQVGSGSSGAPVILKKSIGKPSWSLIGVYIGEYTGPDMRVSYAVRAEAFAHWEPKILDKTILKEANEP